MLDVYLKLLHHVPSYQMLLDDPLQHLGRTAVVVGLIRIDERDGAVPTDLRQQRGVEMVSHLFYELFEFLRVIANA